MTTTLTLSKHNRGINYILYINNFININKSLLANQYPKEMFRVSISKKQSLFKGNLVVMYILEYQLMKKK